MNNQETIEVAMLPLSDGRQIVLSRYTQPDKDQQLLLQRLKLALPAQPPPRITAAHARID